MTTISQPKRIRSATVWSGLARLALAVLLPAAAGHAQSPYRDGSGNVEMALVGDLIITRSLSVYEEPEFLRLRELISGATIGFANLEMLLHNWEDDVIPAAQSGGTYMAAHPDMAKELAWMGFDALSMANNHTMDYTAGGMRSTMRALDAAGLAYAGAGENLALARAPVYRETGDGRVALISVASTFADHMRAGRQRPDMRGRPGLSPLRHETQVTYTVPRDRLDVLKEIRSELGISGREEDEGLRVFGATFAAGNEYSTERVSTPDAQDLEEILAVVRDARRQADWVVVTSHTHESDGDREVPAQFLVTFARQAIEAGADVFFAHGPHVLRGIEIHEGRPIFYSLADFLFQNETPRFLPADNYEGVELDLTALPADFYDARIERSSTGSWPGDPLFWDSAIVLPEFRDHELYRVRIIPLILGYGEERPQRGRPLAASGEDARRILERLRRLSTPFGTEIEIVGDEGVIRGPADTLTDTSDDSR